MAKQNQNKKPKDSEDNGITVSSKPDIEPAAETVPDQEVLNKPAPKSGMGLLASWKHPSLIKK